MKPFLGTNECLSANDYLLSPNSKCFAYLHDDGRIAIYRGSGTDDNHGCLWVSNEPHVKGNYFAIMQGDGNFVIYPGTSMQDIKGPATWATGRNQSGQNFTVRLQDDGILAVHAGSDQRVAWNSARHFLATNEILHVNEYLASDSGRYRACLLEHGDFAVYDTIADDWLWNAGVNGGVGNYFACMQGDGNFVIYRGTDWSNYGQALWSTGAHGEGQYFIYMQDDGNLALYAGTTDNPGRCQWGIGNSVMIDFDMQKYALKFPNNFTITCAQLGLPSAVKVKLMGKNITIHLPQRANCGFCGGMCAAVLKRFNNGTPAPAGTTTPSPGTPLYNELWDRQKRTLAGDVITTMVDRTCSPDKGHSMNPFHSIKVKTKEDWEKRLKPRLDAGKPTILVLIDTEVDVNVLKLDFDFNVDLTKNHQVLAIGYRQYWTPEGFIRIRIYDPNDPNKPHVLRMVFSWEFIDAYDETTKKKYRGFFVSSQTDAASA